MEIKSHPGEHPVALAYGVPSDGYSWTLQEAELLAAGYRAISVDRSGFECSKWSTFGYGYDDFATDLITLLDRLGLEDCVLCEFSMGIGELARHRDERGSGSVVSDRFVHFNFFFDFYNVDVLVPERISRRVPVGSDTEDAIRPVETAAGRLPGLIGDLYLIEVEGGPHSFMNGSGPIIGGKARSVVGAL